MTERKSNFQHSQSLLLAAPPPTPPPPSPTTSGGSGAEASHHFRRKWTGSRPPLPEEVSLLPPPSPTTTSGGSHPPPSAFTHHHFQRKWTGSRPPLPEEVDRKSTSEGSQPPPTTSGGSRPSNRLRPTSIPLALKYKLRGRVENTLSSSPPLHHPLDGAILYFRHLGKLPVKLRNRPTKPVKCHDANRVTPPQEPVKTQNRHDTNRVTPPQEPVKCHDTNRVTPPFALANLAPPLHLVVKTPDFGAKIYMKQRERLHLAPPVLPLVCPFFAILAHTPPYLPILHPMCPFSRKSRASSHRDQVS